MSGFRVAIDIGGTFTDVVLVDEVSGDRWAGKVLSTPSDPSQGFFRALDVALEQAGVGITDCRQVLHATTVATNAVITRTGGPAALIATEGFRDVLEIARQIRHELYDLRTTKPEPLVPRSRAFEVRERLRYDGAVVIPLDEDSVRAVAELIRASGVKSVAVCLLHAYLDPVHEERVAEILREELPELSVSLSSAIAPEIREYPRASTTVANAYVGPVVRAYLGAIDDGLKLRGADLGLWLMKSNGGIATSAAAVERPVEIIESGPAAGMAAAAHYAALVGSRDVVSLDMGGTTAKVGMIERGETRQVQGWEIAAGAGSGSSVAHASGLPILGSVVDLVEIGAGGGSIAWIDAGGILRVGPHSAGAEPGPACYGRGGTEPTVTDANVVLGRIGTAPLAGGRLPLDARAAQGAVGALGAQLGVSDLEAAIAIVEVADSAMAQATRLMTVRRGLDPAEFDLLAFGGAGPLHACRQASELGFRSVIIPPDAGVLSAFGLLASAARVDHRTAFRRRLDGLEPAEADVTLDRLETDAMSRLPESARGDDLRRERAADMRYIGQSWDLRVPIVAGPFDAAALAQLRTDFDALHERTYGYASPDAPVETVHLAITLAGPRPLVAGSEVAAGAAEQGGDGTGAISSRQACVGTAPELVDVAVHRWERLVPGDAFDGPALIDGADSTAYVAPGFQGRVGPMGVLHLVSR
jgi:N-methylhydantoinase A/oxoprolinase/acetone carboxylase beta subunit